MQPPSPTTTREERPCVGGEDRQGAVDYDP